MLAVDLSSGAGLFWRGSVFVRCGVVVANVGRDACRKCSGIVGSRGSGLRGSETPTGAGDRFCPRFVEPQGLSSNRDGADVVRDPEVVAHGLVRFREGIGV